MPASLHLAHLGERLALEPLRDRADRVDAHRADLARAPHDQLGHRALVVERRRCSACADGGEAARRRGARAGRDVFLVLLPRLAQVRVQVDEARARPSLPRTSMTRTSAPSAGGDPRADRATTPSFEKHVRLGVDAAPGIDDPAASQTEIHSSGTP